MGGALLAHTMAGLLDSRQHLSRPRTIFAPFSVDAECGQTLSRFYQQQVKGRKVLLVDDVLNTGQTFARCAELVRGGGGTVIATAEIYDRMEAIVKLDVPNLSARRIQGARELRRRFVPAVSVRSSDHLVLTAHVERACRRLLASVLIVFGSPYVGQLRRGAAVVVSRSVPVDRRRRRGDRGGRGDRLGRREAACGRRPLESSTTDRGRYPGSGPALRARWCWPSRSARATRAWSAAETRTSTSSRRFTLSSTASSPTCSTVPGAAVPTCPEWCSRPAPGWRWESPTNGCSGSSPDASARCTTSLLNAVAVGCGLLFSMAVRSAGVLARAAGSPLASRAWCGAQRSAASRLPVLSIASISVTRSTMVRSGSFARRYDAKALAAAAASRPVRWKCVTAAGRGFRREDHYLSEGLVARSAAESRHHGPRPVDGVE